jgi:tetratricopeptide (TPR) repeat protein
MLLGSVLAGSGSYLAKPGEASGILRDAMRLADRMLAADPDNRQGLEDVAITATSLGDSLRQDKDLPGARAVWVAGMAAAQRLPAADGNDGILSQLYRRMAMALSDEGKLEESLANLRLAEEHAVAAEKDAPNTTMKTLRLADISDTRADVYMAAKRWREAIGEMKSNLAAYVELARRDPGNPMFVENQPAIYAKLGDFYSRAKERENAGKAWRTALDGYAATEARRALTVAEKKDRDEVRGKLSAAAPPPVTK